MARYIGPKSRIARKFGDPIYGPDKYLDRKNFPPGQHGVNKKRKKTSEYGIQLREKQKAKYTYGILERQFRNTFEKAQRIKGVTGEVLLQLLEAKGDFRGALGSYWRARAERRTLFPQSSAPWKLDESIQRMMDKLGIKIPEIIK